MKLFRIILILNSLLLLSCNNTIYCDKKIYLSKIDSDILELSFNKDNLLSQDKFKLSNDIKSILDLNGYFGWNNIIKNILISRNGSLFDLNTRTLIEANNYLFIKCIGDECVFYNFIDKQIIIFYFNETTGSINRKYYTLSSELNTDNGLPYTDLISPNYKKIISFKEKSSIDLLNKFYDVYINEINKNTSNKKIMDDVRGVVMSRYSSSIGIPSFIWLDEDNFLYTNYKENICEIYKYNIVTNVSQKIRNFESRKFNANKPFILDFKKRYFWGDLSNLIEKDSLSIDKNKFYLSDRCYVQKIFNDLYINDLKIETLRFKISKKKYRTFGKSFSYINSKNELVLIDEETIKLTKFKIDSQILNYLGVNEISSLAH